MRAAAVLVLLAAIVGWGLANSAQAASRTAVVIGNANYSVAPLANAGRDAAMIADRLETLGFEVERVFDLDGVGFNELLERIKDLLADAEIGIVYYAGHAVQIGGVSHLLPVDLAELTETEIEAKKIALQDLVHAGLSGATGGLRLFIVDACRDDPFSGLSARIGIGLDTVGGAQASAGVAGEALIAYATSSGQLANDGPPGGNGPFALALDRALDRPGLELSQITRQVTEQVSAATDERQVPWTSGNLRSEYWLNKSTTRALLEQVDADDVALDRVVWWFASSSRAYLEVKRFSVNFRESPFRSKARERMATLKSRAAPVRAPTVEAGPKPALVTPGGPIPADFFRVDRTALRKLPGGLAQAATECDWLAADAEDPRRVAPGIRDGLIDLNRAGQDCAYAHKRFPEVPRFAFQLARVLQIAGLHDWARRYYQIAGNAGYSAALTNLGYLYKRGIGVEKDLARAHQYYLAAADLGNNRARTNVGTDFLRGEGVAEASAEEAVQWYRLASESGRTAAQNALATLYRKGEGVPQDVTTAASLYELAALSGQRDAMNSFGKLLLGSDDHPVDRPRAHVWLERAVDAGDRFAPFTLARDLLATGAAMDDAERVLSLFELSWTRGYPRALLDIAWILEKGEIVPRDADAAYRAAHRADLAGIAKAPALAKKLADELGSERVAQLEARVAAEIRLNGR